MNAELGLNAEDKIDIIEEDFDNLINELYDKNGGSTYARRYNIVSVLELCKGLYKSVEKLDTKCNLLEEQIIQLKAQNADQEKVISLHRTVGVRL